jgi:hypothetical protein
MCLALVQTLGKTFLPTNWQVSSVYFADYYYIPCPYRTCTLLQVKAFTPIALLIQKISNHYNGPFCIYYIPLEEEQLTGVMSAKDGKETWDRILWRLQGEGKHLIALQIGELFHSMLFDENPLET